MLTTTTPAKPRQFLMFRNLDRNRRKRIQERKAAYWCFRFQDREGRVPTFTEFWNRFECFDRATAHRRRLVALELAAQWRVERSNWRLAAN